MAEKKAEQFALNLSNQQSYDADEYIILPSNQALVQQLLEDTHSSSPLTILFGSKMSGKTHLSHLWQQHFAANFLPDEYLRIEEDNFPELAQMIGNSAIIVDDIDQKDICEKTVFHIINLAIQSNQPLLFTSSKPLLLWDVALPDLLSRLKAAKHVEIPAPDDMLMETVLTKAFAEKQLNIADNVIAYILPRINRSIGAIVELVDNLDKQGLQEKKPVTRAMVASFFESTNKG